MCCTYSLAAVKQDIHLLGLVTQAALYLWGVTCATTACSSQLTYWNFSWFFFSKTLLRPLSKILSNHCTPKHCCWFFWVLIPRHHSTFGLWHLLSPMRGVQNGYFCAQMSTQFLTKPWFFWNKIAKWILWSAPTLQRNVHDIQRLSVLLHIKYKQLFNYT